MTNAKSGRSSILVASGNPHKVEEIRAILSPLGIEVLSLGDVAAQDLAEPVEDGDSFAANARIKARYYAAATQRRVLADDSGLAVDALSGAPGIHSARWAGIGASRAQRDEANNRKLLAAMASVPLEKRGARFVCAMCVADPDGSIVAESCGNFPGWIGFAPAGENGFGYDPFLVVDESGRTSAQLSPQEKNARSHRSQATIALAKILAGG